MSELSNALLDAIASGNNEQMNSAFDAVMNAKISDSLQAKKIELANSIYNGVQAKAEAIDDATDGIASDNGSEEV